jgi:Flp pilus assembly protein TadD
MKKNLVIVVCLSSAVLGGCAGGQRAPVVDTSISGAETNAVSTATVDVSGASIDTTGVTESSDVVVTALGDEEVSTVDLAAPAAPSTVPATAAVNPAVVALLNNANAQTRAGKHNEAAASLERALKITPKDAWLWHKLARTRLNLGETGQAQSLAARSNSYAQNDRRLLADNWGLIAEARQLGGDSAGANAAQLRAAQFSEG